jgi:hypothetical protein
MRAGIMNVKRPAAGMERKPDRTGPIRPQGVSSRLPLLLFVALVAALFIGYHYIADSEMYRTAETFIRQNEEIRTTFGEVRHCRLWFPFKVDFPEGVLLIQLTLLVEGSKASTKSYVELKWEGAKWRISSASYEDGKGKLQPLLKKEKPRAPKAEKAQPSAFLRFHPFPGQRTVHSYIFSMRSRYF